MELEMELEDQHVDQQNGANDSGVKEVESAKGKNGSKLNVPDPKAEQESDEVAVKQSSKNNIESDISPENNSNLKIEEVKSSEPKDSLIPKNKETESDESNTEGDEVTEPLVEVIYQAKDEVLIINEDSSLTTAEFESSQKSSDENAKEASGNETVSTAKDQIIEHCMESAFEPKDIEENNDKAESDEPASGGVKPASDNVKEKIDKSASGNKGKSTKSASGIKGKSTDAASVVKTKTKSPSGLVEVETNLPTGWKKFYSTRKSGATMGQIDVYVYSPDGVKFRSKRELAAYLKRTKSTLKLEDFNFSRKNVASELNSKDPPKKVAKAKKGDKPIKKVFKVALGRVVKNKKKI